MKELTRFEIAACKRVAANTKSLRTKVEKLNAKIAELEVTKNTYLSEIKMWETPIMEKYGFSVNEILNGTYLQASCCDDTANTEWVDNTENLEYPSETFESYNAH